MSDSTARAIRLVKAEALRDAAEMLRVNVYASFEGNEYKNGYNGAMEDAQELLLERVRDLEARA